MGVRDFIKVDRTQSAATKAGDLIAFKDAVARVLMLGPPLLAIMNHNFDDSNPNAIVWTDLETICGLPVGAGHTVFDMCNGVMGAMSGTMENDQAIQICARVG